MQPCNCNRLLGYQFSLQCIYEQRCHHQNWFVDIFTLFAFLSFWISLILHNNTRYKEGIFVTNRGRIVEISRECDLITKQNVPDTKFECKRFFLVKLFLFCQTLYLVITQITSYRQDILSRNTERVCKATVHSAGDVLLPDDADFPFYFCNMNKIWNIKI